MLLLLVEDDFAQPKWQRGQERELALKIRGQKASSLLRFGSKTLIPECSLSPVQTLVTGSVRFQDTPSGP